VYVAPHRYVSLFTPSLQWVPWPLLTEALRFPTFVGTMGSYDCCRPFPATSGLPWRQVLHVEGLFASRGTPSFPSGPGSFWVGQNPYPARERSAALLGSREVLLKACPGLATPATPKQPRIIGCLDAAFRYRNGVGIAMVNDFGAEPSRPASSLCTLPPVGRPTSGNTRYWSACCALARPDLHRRDFFERFHCLIQIPLSRAFPSAIR
jgi:hypothetical protein